MMAASTVSCGIPRSAAERITMAKPVWIQIIMAIRKKLFQNGIVSQDRGCRKAGVIVNTSITFRSARTAR